MSAREPSTEVVAVEGTGTYTLLIDLDAEATITVGSLGPIDFSAGTYAYTGSAMGPGGLARVDRHHATARGETTTLHWHIDHLLAADGTSIVAVGVTRDRVECETARALPGDRIPGFGCSDCSCDSHLVHAERDTLRAALRDLHDRVD